MNHLEVYTDLWLESKKFPDLNTPEAEKALSNYFMVRWSYLDISYIKNALQPEAAPKPSQLIPELIRRGYRPKFIANLLGTTNANVSYHKLHPSKAHYENPVFLYHIEGVYRYKKYDRYFYKRVNDTDDF